jgi:hypothetical protein
MYINAHTVVITLILITIGCYGGLQLVRKFALQIAQENHDAIVAMDAADNEKHKRRVYAADQAAAAAYAKVQQQPLLPITVNSTVQLPSPVSGNNNLQQQSAVASPASGASIV